MIAKRKPLAGIFVSSRSLGLVPSMAASCTAVVCMYDICTTTTTIITTYRSTGDPIATLTAVPIDPRLACPAAPVTSPPAHSLNAPPRTRDFERISNPIPIPQYYIPRNLPAIIVLAPIPPGPTDHLCPQVEARKTHDRPTDHTYSAVHPRRLPVLPP